MPSQLKNTIVSLLAFSGLGVYASPTQRLASRDGWHCNNNDWCRRIRCNDGNAFDGNPFWPDYTPIPSEGVGELGHAMEGCCTDGTIGNRWVAPGKPLTCDVKVNGGRQRVTLTTEVSIGGFQLDARYCADTLAYIAWSCWKDGDRSSVGGCNTSADGNFRACVWPHKE